MLQIRQLEKQAALRVQEAQAQDEALEELEWELLARWQPSKAQVEVLGSASLLSGTRHCNQSLRKIKAS